MTEQKRASQEGKILYTAKTHTTGGRVVYRKRAANSDWLQMR